MKARTARWLAWALVGIFFLATGIGFALQFASHKTITDLGFPSITLISLVCGIWCIVGALIVSYHPRHPVGWIMLLALYSWAPVMLAFGYVAYDGISGAGSAILLDLSLVLLAWSGEPFTVFALTLLFLLYPTGRPLSRRWRLVAWIAAGALVLSLILALLSPQSLEYTELPDNFSSPLAVSEQTWAGLDPVHVINQIVQLLCVLAAGLSLVLRLRRATSTKRQQIKWFVYASAFYPPNIPILTYYVVTGAESQVFLYVGAGLIGFASLFMAIAITVAIFRYRLYDIDLIINRTLVYGALTGTLALVYFVGVILLQRVFPAESQLAVVLSTLTIAALFSPLRRRIQNAIDRRFYRRRYDAERAVAMFSTIVRDQVELESLSTALLTVVEETVQPSQIQLWLRQTKG